MDKVSDGPSDMTSLTGDSSAVTGSSETSSRRGRRNRRDRHKNSTKTPTSDSGLQLTSADDPGSHGGPTSTVSLVDSQSSGRNKSSVAGSSSSLTVTNKDKGSMVDAVKLASLPSSSVTGNAMCCAVCTVSVLSSNKWRLVGVDDSSLHADSQPNCVGLVHRSIYSYPDTVLPIRVVC